jgi:ABC-type anion transport system duplicated permease subunit
LVSIAVAAGLTIGFAALLVHFVYPHNAFDISRISFSDIARGTLNTFYRMALAFILSLIVSIPVALFMAATPRRQRILLPIADILQSVPVLAFFPIVAAFFVANNAFELAAVFVIFIQMLWNIVFPVVGGLQTIPDDIKSAAFCLQRSRLAQTLVCHLAGALPVHCDGISVGLGPGMDDRDRRRGPAHPPSER